MEKITVKQIFTNYNLFYFFIIVIAMARASKYAMCFEAYYNVFTFVVPLLMTFVFIRRNRVRFNNKSFLLLMCCYVVWFVLQAVKFSGSNFSLSFHFFYQLIVAYSIAHVFKEKFFFTYEQIVVKLAVFSTIVWFLNIVATPLVDAIFEPISFPIRTGITKYNIGITSVLNLSYGGDLYKFRNPGFGWEPGMFSVFLCMAILSNLIAHNFKIKNNTNLLLLFIALITTQSTTGYSAFLLSIVPFYILNARIKYKVFATISAMVIAFIVYNLDFMGKKISSLQSSKETIEYIQFSVDYHSSRGDEVKYTPQRFDGLALEMLNIKNDPLIGYGVDFKNSFVGNTFEGVGLSENVLLPFAKFGCIMGVIIYLYYFLCAYKISKIFKFRHSVFYVLFFATIGISYPLLSVPMVLAFLYLPVCMPKKHLLM